MAPSVFVRETASQGSEFRKFVPDPGHPRIAGLDQTDLNTYSNKIASDPHVIRVFEKWKGELRKPFYGITTDGQRKEGIFKRADEGAPIEGMVCI
jgi:hypothetical protein